MPGTGRYSVAAFEPFLIFEAKGRKVQIRRRGKPPERSIQDPFEALRSLLAKHAFSTEERRLPFCGGALGYVGYEAKYLIEPGLPDSAKEGMNLPDLYFMFVDSGIVWDHERAEMRLFAGSKAELKKWRKKIVSFSSETKKRSKTSIMRPILRASLDKQSFMESVRSIKKLIRKGEIYQANLSRRLDFPVKEDPLQIYARLRRINPSPFFGYLDSGTFQILSGSPERLLKLDSGNLETRPIAGTRSRGRDEREDAALEKALLLSPKERAEHIMLVDLERNDLGRVSEYGSVRVDELMAIENYSHVKHIVSSVRGRLKKGCDAIDAFKAFFPGGTITGAPKVRCMEILDQLEPVARGPYTGSMGYFSFMGDMDFNIIIRSLVVQAGRGYLQTGAGIVADSIPKKEYEETNHKAKAVLQAVFGKRR